MTNLVFGGWDIFEDDMYAAAVKAGVLESQILDGIKPELESVKPMPAVFDQSYVKRLSGTHVKKGKTKMDLADQLRKDLQDFKAQSPAKPAGHDLVRQHGGLYRTRPGAPLS